MVTLKEAACDLFTTDKLRQSEQASIQTSGKAK